MPNQPVLAAAASHKGAMLLVAALLAVAGVLLMVVFGATSEEGVSIITIRADGVEAAPFTQYRDVEHPVRRLIGALLLAIGLALALLSAVVGRKRRSFSS